MIVLKLHKEIFDLPYITAAVEAYQQLADIAVDTDGSYWSCIFTKCRYNEKQTATEFENYVIDLTNNKKQ